MEGSDAKKSRKRYKFLMRAFIGVYIVIGLASLAKYTYIGMTEDLSDGKRYISTEIKMEAH